MSAARWKPIAILIAVFVLGGAAGVGAGRTLAMKELAGAMRGPPTEARARFRMEAMRRHLDLDDAQATAIEAIVTEAETERETLMATCGPPLEELRVRTDERIRAVLRPDQRSKHEELERRRPRHGPRGGPRGAGDHHPPAPPPDGH